MEGHPPPPPYSVQDPSPRPPATTAVTGSVNNVQNGTTFVSGAAYFAMRPPTQPKTTSTLPCHIAVLRDTTSTDLPMPKPEQTLIDRDVTPHDWLAFINHLVPCNLVNPSSSAVQEKLGGKHAVDTAAQASTERTRQQDVIAIVQEWNQGFFQPRGIKIIARSEIIPPAQPSSGSRPSIPRPPAESTSRKGTADEKPQLKHRDTGLGKALYRAVEKQDIKTSKMLLEAGADPDARPSWETPAIVVAVKNDNTQLLQMLLDYCPDIEAHATGNGTALHTAVTKGRLEMVKLLLAHGADPNKRPMGAEPPLYKAVSKHYDAIVELLLQQENIHVDDNPPGGTTAMYQAAKKGNIELVRKLVAVGANVDARPAGTNTAMFEAAKKGSYDICKLLLESGAQVDARTTGGETALRKVVGKDDLNMIRLLLDHGANVSAKACGGETALEKAVTKRKQGQVELLLQYR
ncbi:MAG: hypothetical protein L6R36_002853 [Xanthoria steineri]|nr:MAG: hypothetical protein L6R36_002853 [Xanthoria steineri]